MTQPIAKPERRRRSAARRRAPATAASAAPAAATPTASRSARPPTPTDRSMPPVRMTKVMPTATTSRKPLSMKTLRMTWTLENARYCDDADAYIDQQQGERGQDRDVPLRRPPRPRLRPSVSERRWSCRHLRLLAGSAAGGGRRSAACAAARRTLARNAGDWMRQTAITTSALNSSDVCGGMPIGVDRGGQRLDDQRAEHRAADGEPAAGQRRAADDDGEDRVELDPQAGVVAVGAGDVRA